MFKLLKKFFQRNECLSVLVALAVIFTVIAGVILMMAIFFPGILANNHIVAELGYHEISSILVTFVLAILTAILAVVAWIQLTSLFTIAKSDFLLDIDKRYGSEKILEARSILRRMYCEIAKDETLTVPEVERKVSKAIKVMAKEAKKDSASDFICLLNFLDFLETIAYYKNEDKIKADEVKEVIGGSLECYERMLSGLIEYINDMRKQDDSYRSLKKRSIEKHNECSPYYCELKQAVKNRKKNKQCLFCEKT